MKVPMLGDEARKREELAALFFQLLEKPYAKYLLGVLKDLFIKLLGDDNSLWSVTLGNVLRREENVYKAFNEHESLFASWTRRYLSYLGVKKPNFKNLFVPKKPSDGNGRLIVNVLRDSIFDSHDSWSHLVGELHIFNFEPKDIARPSVGYSAWLAFPPVESKKETCSVRDLREQARHNLFIEDVILFLIAHFEETGEKFSMDGINILCPASCTERGAVMLILGRKNGLEFHLVDSYIEQPGLCQPRKTH